MAGITTGLIVSLVGLVVGRTVGYIWIRAFRHKLERQPATQSVRASRYREGKGLLADEEIDPPPVYEHAPAYDELVSEEKRTVD
jgi:threonine dehydrogenase-like Zn-dependent dehydrogenase